MLNRFPLSDPFGVVIKRRRKSSHRFCRARGREEQIPVEYLRIRAIVSCFIAWISPLPTLT